jgi:hypothetical protein
MSVNKSGMASVEETAPTGGFSNVSETNNTPVNMGAPSPKPRSFRAEQLIETMSNDSYDLNPESPRHTKMVG